MNVVFILADDLGWSDTELYGKTKLYNTPNILQIGRTRLYLQPGLCKFSTVFSDAGQFSDGANARPTWQHAAQAPYRQCDS